MFKTTKDGTQVSKTNKQINKQNSKQMRFIHTNNDILIERI